MSKKQTLSFYSHQYPVWILKHPQWIQVAYVLNYMLQLRKWYIMQTLKKMLRGQPQFFRLLDAGCGEGQYLFPLAKRYRQSNFIGIDKQESNINFCRLYAKKSGFRNSSFQILHLAELHDDSLFDFVLCIGVLQYISDDRQALNCLYHSLQPTGKLLLYVPVNNHICLPFYQTLAHRFINYETAQQRQRNYTEAGIMQLLKDIGFTVLEKTHTYGFFGQLSNEIQNSCLILINHFPLPMRIVMGAVCIIVYPLILLFMILDFLLPKKMGNGLLVVSKK